MTRFLSPWVAFIGMRFPVTQYLTMVGVFTAAHAVVAAGLPGGESRQSDLALIFIVGAGCLAFFLLLRIYDELKDYGVDVLIHPDRPLARGLITHRALGHGIVACIGAALIASWLAGLHALVSTLIVIGYSLLMYREFFVPRFLRPKLTTYAVTHTAVSVLLSISLIVAFTGRSLLELNLGTWAFALAAWCLFSVFEFGRKTFASTEEREGVDSYSGLFGRWGAIALNVLTAALGSALLAYAAGEMTGILSFYLVGVLVILGMAGILYARTDCSVVARVYRALTNVYIVAVYAGVVLFCSN